MSLVGRGLGRKAAAAALLVTAGLGLGLLVDEEVTSGGSSQVYGGAALPGDDELSRHVRASWEMLEAKLAASRPIHVPGERQETAQPRRATSPNLEPTTVAPIEQEPPHASPTPARHLVDDGALVALLLSTCVDGAQVVAGDVSTMPTEDELLLLTAALQADPSVAG